MTKLSKFIKPHHIDELGGLGLTMADIAISLQTEAIALRRKLIGRGFLERIKAQGFQWVPIVIANKINNIEFTEYALDVLAAKFFVAKYDSEMGDSYLAFLIDLEQSAINSMAQIQSDPILKSLHEGLKIRQAQIEHEHRIRDLEDQATEISDAMLDMQLSNVQREKLKELIDAKAYALGSPKLIGQIQKDLKNHFDLNPTNSKWYHISQRDYKEAVDFVGDWGKGSVYVRKQLADHQSNCRRLR